jgi:hypothetical protein
MREQCWEKHQIQKIDNSIHKEHHDRMHQKLTKPTLCQKTMRGENGEPVIGTHQFTNMKRTDTRGINKQTNTF